MMVKTFILKKKIKQESPYNLDFKHSLQESGYSDVTLVSDEYVSI